MNGEENEVVNYDTLYADFPTYISFRPRWTEIGVSEDARKSATVFRRIRTVGGTTKSFLSDVSISIPNLATPKRGRGRPSKDDVPFGRYDPRRPIYEAFGSKQFEFEIRIGIVEDGAVHYGIGGRPISYNVLFGHLDGLGFNPLDPIEALRDHFERHLASEIYAISKRIDTDNTSYMTIRRAIESWARNMRDVVRDYIRGSISISKLPVSEGTVRRREIKARHNDGLYEYGIDNALWETGTLESDIGYKVIPIKDGEFKKLGSITPQMRNQIKQGREKMKQLQDKIDTRDRAIFDEKNQFLYRFLSETREKHKLSYKQTLDQVAKLAQAEQEKGRPLSGGLKKFWDSYSIAKPIADRLDLKWEITQ